MSVGGAAIAAAIALAMIVVLIRWGTVSHLSSVTRQMRRNEFSWFKFFDEVLCGESLD
jgi:hypothetical protein